MLFSLAFETAPFVFSFPALWRIELYPDTRIYGMIKYHLLFIRAGKERASEWHTEHYTANTARSCSRK